MSNVIIANLNDALNSLLQDAHFSVGRKIWDKSRR